MIEQIVARRDGSEHLLHSARRAAGIGRSLGRRADYGMGALRRHVVFVNLAGYRLFRSTPKTTSMGRELFSPTAAREPPEFFHSADHDAVGNVYGNFDLADFARQDEVHDPALSFFVGL